MWLWLVQHVVDPSQALLHTNVPPLNLGHQVGLGDQLGQVLWEHHVPVLELLVSVLVTVVNVLVRHGVVVLRLEGCTTYNSESKQTNETVLKVRMDDQQRPKDNLRITEKQRFQFTNFYSSLIKYSIINIDLFLLM